MHPVILLAGLLALGAPPAAARAQARSGDFVLTRDGGELLAARLSWTADGRVTGTIASGGAAQPVRGTIAGGRLTLTMQTADGGTTPVTGTLADGRLTLTFTDGAARESFTLERRGAGWSDATLTARRWRARLAGRAVSITERTGGGPSGGATTQRDFAFCPDGVAHLRVSSVVSVNVPGASGSQTSRDTATVRWRELARGAEVGLEITNPRDGEVFQLGLSGGDGAVIRLGEQAARLVEAGGRCR